jgi:glycosyltransferase involved in cell wall biosynthesis
MYRIAFIDGQVFQSAAWDRGMGKYSLCLLSALRSEKKYDYNETYIIFTDRLELKKEARQAVINAMPDAKLVFLNLGIPNIHDHDSIESLMRRNTSILNGFIKRTITDVTLADFVILSLFIDQVCSVFPQVGRKILLFYDLIPLQYSDRYGSFHSYSNYLRRYKIVLEADYIWTISQTVADDLAVYMGLDTKKILNINGAPIERGHQESRKPTHIEIPDRYLLMPSGNDLRKNNERAIQAVAEYNQVNQDDISVVITSFFDDETRGKLRGGSDKVIFTGNVSEGELRWLYENADALLFVPEYEGLGLPILEAVEFSVPVVCSNLTVFDEMSPTAFYNGDQFTSTSIATAIMNALRRKDWQNKLEEYPEILSRYTWQKTAQVALDFVHKDTTTKARAVPKPRVAVFTPDPAGYSAIGKFNLHLHPALSEYFDIDYYVEKGVGKKAAVRPSYLSEVATTYDAKDFNAKKYADYDAVLYHVGNSEFHLNTIKNALYLPGYAVMHDTNLKPIFEQGLFEHEYITKERLDAEQLLDDLLESKQTSHIGSILNNQLGVVGHSNYTVQAMAAITSDVFIIKRANLPVATPVMKKRSIESRFSIGFAGIIHPAKGLSLLDMIVESGLFADAHIYLFGIPLVPDAELRRIDSLPNVTVLTNLTDFEFQSKLADIDVLINYRPDYNGEASAATVEAMRLGVVPIVRKIGWFDELPDDSVLKVEGQDGVMPAIKELYDDRAKLQKMSYSARETTRREFNQQKYAKDIADMISRKLSLGSNTRRVSEALKRRAPKKQVRTLIDHGSDSIK